MFLSRGTAAEWLCVSKGEEEGDCQWAARYLCPYADNLIVLAVPSLHLHDLAAVGSYMTQFQPDTENITFPAIVL